MHTHTHTHAPCARFYLCLRISYVQGEVALASKAEAVAQDLKAAGKSYGAKNASAQERGDKGISDEGAGKKDRERKLHRLTRKKRRRILAQEAEQREEKEEREELRAQGVPTVHSLVLPSIWCGGLVAIRLHRQLQDNSVWVLRNWNDCNTHLTRLPAEDAEWPHASGGHHSHRGTDRGTAHNLLMYTSVAIRGCCMMQAQTNPRWKVCRESGVHDSPATAVGLEPKFCCAPSYLPAF